MKQMARREPIAWLPDDCYVYDLTWREIARMAIGTSVALMVGWGFLLGLLALGQ
jgi:hypothetical protein